MTRLSKISRALAVIPARKTHFPGTSNNDPFERKCIDMHMTPAARKYISRVYGNVFNNLAICSASTTLPVIIPALANPWVSIPINLSAFLFTLYKKDKLSMKLFASSNGILCGPAILASPFMGVILPATVVTMSSFAVATVVAKYTKTSSTLNFEAPLFGGILGLVALSVARVCMVPIPFTEQIIMYGGLLLFTTLITYDTHRMCEDANNGMEDVYQATINIFLDILNIFILSVDFMRGGNKN